MQGRFINTMNYRILSFLLVPWAPFDYLSKEQGANTEQADVVPDIKKPSLYNIYTIVTTIEKFSRSVGGITLEKLYPYHFVAISIYPT